MSPRFKPNGWLAVASALFGFKAIATLKRVLALDPGNVRGLESLAVAFEILDDRENAEFYRSKLRERPPQ